MPFTAEQQAERLKGVGASEVAAIVGLNPFKSAMDVFMEKRGIVPPFAGNTATKWGNKLEDVVRSAYLEQMEEGGMPLGLDRTFDGTRTVWKPGTPYFCTPDAIVYRDLSPFGEDGYRWGLECKVRDPRGSDQWGAPGTDQIPADIAIQCQWSMGVTGIKRWDVAVLLGNKDFRIYSLTFSPEVWDELETTVAEFWRQTEAGIAPPLDASEGTQRFLKAVYGTQQDRDLVPATPELEAAMCGLHVLKSEMKAMEEEAATHEAVLKNAIGVHGGLDAPTFRATWNQAKPSLVTDWKAAFYHLVETDETMNAQSTDAIIRQFTTEKPGSRRFLLTVKGVKA